MPTGETLKRKNRGVSKNQRKHRLYSGWDQRSKLSDSNPIETIKYLNEFGHHKVKVTIGTCTKLLLPKPAPLFQAKLVFSNFY